MDAPAPPAVLPYQRAPNAERPDDCYRCGYPLFGIADEQPCPECGLLARRSRRTTDELHNTRPRWLRRISRGVNLILLALLTAAISPFVFVLLSRWVRRTLGVAYDTPLPGFAIAAIVLLIGVWLLASKEGYPPADSADRRLRVSLRLAGLVPLLVVALFYVYLWLQQNWFRFGIRPSSFTDLLGYAAAALGTVGLAPLPLLVFLQLRGLATRARSAHLAEHCAIVGIGASCAFLFAGGYSLLSHNAARWGLGSYWSSRGLTSLLLVLALSVAAFLFTGWSIYLLVRFAIAFRAASRALRQHWRSDDRSLGT